MGIAGGRLANQAPQAVIARYWAALALAGVTGCAGPEHLDVPKVRLQVELSPYSVHEECIAMQRNERIGYVFEARVPVAFSIQYTDGNAVILPLTRDSTTDEAGDFIADRDHTYCLVWKSGAEGSAIAYRLRRLGDSP